MALGGGTFVTQNKKLPGTYTNYISAAKASASASDRGYAAMAFVLDWGIDGEVFTVTTDEFKKDSLKLFGYDYTHEKLKGLRDLFSNIKTLYAYKLNSTGAKATNTYATAKYSGVRGNALKIIIQKNLDDATRFDVSTYLESSKIEMQTVKVASELVDNDFVVWKKDASLTVSAGIALDGGTNGASVTAAEHQTFLNKIESYTFNAIGVVSETDAINRLYSEFTKRVRTEYGVKFQSVTWHNAADDEGNVNVKNEAIEEGTSKASMIYWITGIIAACEVNKSNTNKRYTGEFKPNTEFTQAQLETCIDNGEFVLHQVGADVRVLLDINSLITTSDQKGDIFKDNQTIRVIDYLSTSDASIFNTKYLGVVPNDASGRISLKTDLVKVRQDLMDIRAIENFDAEDVAVELGNTKKSVVVTDTITIVNAMTQLYMTTTVE